MLYKGIPQQAKWHKTSNKILSTKFLLTLYVDIPFACARTKLQLQRLILSPTSLNWPNLRHGKGLEFFPKLTLQISSKIGLRYKRHASNNPPKIFPWSMMSFLRVESRKSLVILFQLLPQVSTQENQQEPSYGKNYSPSSKSKLGTKGPQFRI